MKTKSKKYLSCLMLLVLFVIYFIFGVHETSLNEMLRYVGISAFIVALIVTGMFILVLKNEESESETENKK